MVNYQLKNNDFFSNCAKFKKIPEDVDSNVFKAYELMNKQMWSRADIDSYELKLLNEQDSKIMRLGDKIVAEIDKVKFAFKLKVNKDDIIPYLKYLTDEAIKHNLDSNLKYISEHMDDSESDICDKLKLDIALYHLA